MKRSLILLLQIAVITVVTSELIAKGIERFASDVYTGQAYGKINQFLVVKDTCEFIVLGSSRANHHIDPTLLTSKSFNMGLDGREFFFHTAMFYAVPDSTTVLFHIDPSDFFDDGDSMDRLVPHFGKNNEIDKALMRNGGISILERIFSSLRFNNTMLSILGNKYIPKYDIQKYHGYDPIYPSKIDSLNFKRSSMSREELKSQIGESINQEVIKQIIKIRDHSHLAGITCIFFTSPLFYGLHESDREFMRATFEKLGLIYLDYSNLMVGSEQTNWKDGTHLSHFGAQIFSRKILTDIKRPTNISANGL